MEYFGNDNACYNREIPSSYSFAYFMLLVFRIALSSTDSLLGALYPAGRHPASIQIDIRQEIVNGPVISAHFSGSTK